MMFSLNLVDFTLVPITKLSGTLNHVTPLRPLKTVIDNILLEHVGLPWVFSFAVYTDCFSSSLSLFVDLFYSLLFQKFLFSFGWSSVSLVLMKVSSLSRCPTFFFFLFYSFFQHLSVIFFFFPFLLSKALQHSHWFHLAHSYSKTLIIFSSICFP